MSIRFASLGSGSKGNGTLITCGDTCLLVDCGFTIKETVKRLAQLGVTEPGSLAGILVTHEHGDHLSGVAPLARRFNLPVWMSYGTRRVARDVKNLTQLQLFHAGERLRIGDAEVTPFTVPHDAAEPCQFTFQSPGAKRLVLLTDLGKNTPYVQRNLQGCDGILLECNYDTEMMRDGPYPPALQARITGDYGHLGNQQAAEILASMTYDRLQHIVLSHLSEQNNTPEKAQSAILEAVPERVHERVSVSSQQKGTAVWHEIL